ncbi:MAG: AAA family ATPase, partial [Kofleriaceae bacterium]
MSLIGRHEELAQLEAGLDLVLAGGARSVAIVGEAGVGKSRLVDELARTAAARGVPRVDAMQGDGPRLCIIEVEAGGPRVELPGLYLVVTTRATDDPDALRLAPLPAADARALARAARVPDELHERALALAGGNPLFLTQLGRLLSEQPATGEPVLPMTIAEIIGERIRGLDAAARSALWTAVILGRFEPSAADPALLATGLVVATSGGLRFAHPEVREAALVDARASGGWIERHDALASALAAAGGDPANIARLYLQGSDRRRAVPFLAAAGERATRDRDYADAVAWYDQALDLVPAGPALRALHLGRLHAIARGGLGQPDPRADEALAAAAGELATEVAVRLELARIAIDRGRFTEAIARAAEARGRAARLDAAEATARADGEGHRIAGLARLGLGQLAAARAELDAAVAAVERTGDRATRARARTDRGLVLGYAGEFAAALADHEAALALLPEGEALDVRAAAHNNLGFAAWGLGRDDAERHLGAALALRKTLRDRHGEGVTRNNLGNVWRHRGDLERAREDYLKAIELCRAAGNAVHHAIAIHNLGQVEEEAGDLAAAERLYREALAQAVRLGDRIREGDNLGSLGVCLLSLGRTAEAVGMLRRAVGVRRALGDAAYLVRDLSFLALAELGAGEREAARAAIDEAIGALDHGLPGVERAQEVYLNAFKILRALGEHVRAESCLARARELVGASSGRLRVDREILALWQDAGAPEVRSRPPERRTEAPFVGRPRELAALTGALARAAHSEGSLWLVSGEQGIGKTRLLDELGRRARADGMAIAWGRADDSDDAPAFGAWLQALHALVADVAASDVGTTFDEAVRVVWSGAPGRGVADAVASFQVLDAFMTLLRLASALRPLVVLLDDLHAADPATLQLLALAAVELRHSPVLVVGTYDDRGRSAALDEVARGASTLRLTGLSADETSALIAAHLGGAAPSLATSVHERSDGNPLFAVELALHLRSLGQDAPATWTGDTPLPTAIEGVIALRLGDVAPATREVLEAAAVAGRTFALARVAPLTRWNEAGCLLAMEEAMQAGLVVARGEDRFGFASGLVRAGLLRGIAVERRAALHLAFARAAETALDRGVAPRYAELARHFALGGGPADEIARYERLAGHQAMARAAFAEAARCFERALGALAPAAASARCEVLASLGQAQLALGHAQAAAETFARISALARTVEDPVVLARAILAAPDDADLSRHTSEALARLGEREPALRARLLGRGGTEAQARQAIEIARAAGDERLLAEVVLATAAPLWRLDNVEESIALVTEVDEIAARLGDPALLATAAYARFLVLLALGDSWGAEQELARSARLARERHEPLASWHAAFGSAMMALEHGQLDEAERLSDEAQALAERTGLGQRGGGARPTHKQEGGHRTRAGVPGAPLP